MASYQVLPALDSGGMDGTNQMMNKYMAAMFAQKLQNKYDAQKKQKYDIDYQSAIQSARKRGDEVTEEYGPDGYTFKAKTKKPLDLNEAAKNVFAGLGTEDETAAIGNKFGVEKPQPEAVMTNIDGSTGYFPAKDWADAIREQALPNYTKEQALASSIGVSPNRMTKQGVPDGFVQDFQAAVESANDDENQFIENLKGLAEKYPDNPDVLKIVNEHLTINTKKAKKEEDEDIFNF